MTLDESFQVAVERLHQQGQLLNGQLLRLLEGDKDAFREIRARLISEGFAEDRFGVGLGRLGNAPGIVIPDPADQIGNESSQESERSAENESNSEWYLMASGLIQGPMTFDSLCEMRMCGEIQPADVVRNGAYGLWQRPDDVTVLAAIKPNQRQRSPKIPVEEIQRLESLTPSKGGSRDSSPASKPAIEESGFYFWESGRSVGPVSRHELLDRLKAGRLNRDEFVRVGIDGEWQPVWAIITETNFVNSVPSDKSFEPLNEPTQQRDNDRDLHNTEMRTGSLRPIHTPQPAYYQVTRKQFSPSISSNPTTSDRIFQDQRQRNNQNPSSLSDVDIEQLDVRPRFEVSTPPVPTSPKSVTTTRSVTSVKAPPAEPLATRFRHSKSAIKNLWRRASHRVGGEKRLTSIMLTLAVLFGISLWMRQPPSANSIYQEFNRYHTQITELKNRGENDQAKWKHDVARALSRTQSLVTGLKDPRTGASALRPAKQELLWAGQNSLLRLLESPNIDAQSAKGLEEQFEYHMSQARRLLDGGTRALPKDFVSKSNRPNDSGPPRAGTGVPPGSSVKPAVPPRP